MKLSLTLRIASTNLLHTLNARMHNTKPMHELKTVHKSALRKKHRICERQVHSGNCASYALERRVIHAPAVFMHASTQAAGGRDGDGK